MLVPSGRDTGKHVHRSLTSLKYGVRLAIRIYEGDQTLGVAVFVLNRSVVAPVRGISVLCGAIRLSDYFSGASRSLAVCGRECAKGAAKMSEIGKLWNHCRRSHGSVLGVQTEEVLLAS